MEILQQVPFVSMIWNRPEFSLFIDLGTNGELVFGNSDFYDELCMFSRTGFFEGERYQLRP